ncbi:COP23 domain-containing protein [Desmonostoc muscorum LEGE 12446]|uniref:Circadian oscillating COP23 family protein n=1 Tax=Desmonostoc muscorum LEGE 12446 TaxID=1828758 RepID=A0A8J7DC03_DESMC|nr:COP23 domain-containing protein [Desmonostoc muscorum]MCF2146299.1 COP23 domain-containing protein [Desmonostoc muscorum LEGE 12446]
MLRQSLAILSGVALLSGLGAVFNTPSYAAGTIQFSCDTSSQLPATRATNTATGASLSVIRWYSEYFTGSGYDPMTRCQQVSARFQQAHNTGSLDYITAGIVNGMPVICAASPGGSCNASNLLFTLKRGVNAAETLQRLFDVRDGAGPALYESKGRTYVNLTKKLAPLNASRAGAGSNGGAATPSKPGRAF